MGSATCGAAQLTEASRRRAKAEGGCSVVMWGRTSMKRWTLLLKVTGKQGIMTTWERPEGTSERFPSVTTGFQNWALSNSSCINRLSKKCNLCRRKLWVESQRRLQLLRPKALSKLFARWGHSNHQQMLLTFS